jgi:hypothetical protein
MATLTIRLRQHTPIIHFQSDRAYATIRATELKPKLDKFIINDLKAIDPQLYKNNNDLITKEYFPMEPDDKMFSKYKIRIAAVNPKENIIKFAPFVKRQERIELEGKNIIVITPAPYFADAMAVTHRDIHIEIFSFNNKLLNLIKDSLPYVLAYDNFGTRQSKGFGCFLPDEMSSPIFEIILLKKYPIIYVQKDIDEPFRLINNEYQLLKSGKNNPNNPNEYRKSKLAIDFISKGIRWEKRKIKQEFMKLKKPLKGTQTDDYGRTEDLEYRYIRALLGLADHNEYQSTLPNHKLTVKIEDSCNESGKKIARFRSPITFKIYRNANNKFSVYLVWNEIPSEMLNRDFIFNLVEKSRQNHGWIESNLGKSFNLATPRNFDLSLFLKKYLSKNWIQIRAKEKEN